MDWTMSKPNLALSILTFDQTRNTFDITYDKPSVIELRSGRHYCLNMSCVNLCKPFSVLSIL